MNSFLGIIVMILIPAFFVFLIIAGIKEGFSQMELPKLSVKEILYIEIIFAIMLIWVYSTIKENDFIYFWDYGREWKSALSVKNNLLNNPIEALKSIYYSINNEDYNQLMPILIALPLYVIDASFEAYVFLVETIYMVPAIIIITLLIYKIFRLLNIEVPSIPIVVAIIASTPILHYVMFDGFMDSPVLMLIAVTILLGIDFDYSTLQLKRCFLLSLDLTLLVLFRRHFAYFVVGFLFSQLLSVAIELHGISKSNAVRLIKGYIKNTTIIGIVALIILGGFFSGFLFRSIFNNFSVAYKAYDVSLIEKLTRVPEVFGGLVLILAIVFSTVCMFKNKKALKIIVSLFANIIVTTILLWRVLQMNYHQYYLIVIQIIILEFIGVFGVSSLFEKKKKKITKYVAMFMCTISLMNMGAVFEFQFRSAPGNVLFSKLSYTPKKRNDKNEILRLVNDLNSIVMEKPDIHFYTLASSGILNYNIITMSMLPDIMNAVPNMYSTHEVDLRDGFPTSFFDAEYVLVANPIQLHLPEGTQEVVSYLASAILDSDSIIGKYYKIEKTYNLDNEVTVGLYKRTCGLKREVYDDLKNYFVELYPDYPELFAHRLTYPESFFPSRQGESLSLNFTEGILKTQFTNNVNNVVSEGEGFLIYGPYKRIEPGQYAVEYILKGNNGDINENIGYVDVYANGKVIAKENIVGGNNTIKLDNVMIDDIYDDIELRIFVTVSGISFDEIIVTRK